jgi:[acyl-carrier-protein] S-malonyltransferase
VQVAMLFPGQGSQAVGMGADLVEAYPEARDLFARADAASGLPLSRACFGGPLETLTETRYAQPALLVHSVAVLRVLEARGVAPAIVAGHSVGEYAALVAAGVLDFDAALRVVQRRGELMFESGRHEPGTMAAVMGLAIDAVEKVCAEVRDLGVCDLANLNAPDQVVISGSVAAVDAALPRLTAAGARMVKRLTVSGAFHSALMRGPGAELATTLAAIRFARARVPVIANVSGEPEQDGERLRDLLAQQIASPVRWVQSMHTLGRSWQGAVLEVGTGSVLRGLLRRIDRTRECVSLGDRATLEDWLHKNLPPAPPAG